MGAHDPSPPADTGPGAAARPAPARYAERLGVPWWFWLLGLGGAAVLAAEVHSGYAGWRAWLPYAVAVPAVAALLWWLGRVRVSVVDGELRVDDAHIPVALLRAAEPLDAAGARRALGVELHPLAFVVHRPWTPTAVRLHLDDPADPTPYWVVSCRHPDRLVAALGLGAATTPDRSDRAR